MALCEDWEFHKKTWLCGSGPACISLKMDLSGFISKEPNSTYERYKASAGWSHMRAAKFTMQDYKLNIYFIHQESCIVKRMKSIHFQ